MTPEPTPPAKNPRLVLEVLAVTAAALGAVVLVDANPTGSPLLRKLPLAPAIWIYVPLLVLMARRQPIERYGLSLANWRGGLTDAAAVLAVLVPTYAIGHMLFRIGIQGHRFVAPFAGDVGDLLASNLLAIGLPEELFFRGYVLTRLEDAFGPGRKLWGGRLGLAVFASALIFNAAHPLAGGSWWQGNMPFGILLGWLWCRRGNLVAPTLVHGITNVVFILLERSIR